VLVVPATLFTKNLFRTKVGRAFIAIRDRDVAAGVMGVSLFRYKLLAFLISSFYAGVAGGLMAHHSRILFPDAFTLLVAIDYLAMIIIGGLGSVLGSIFVVMVDPFLTLLKDDLPGAIGAELAPHVLVAVDTLGGHVGIQLERVPGEDRRGRIRPAFAVELERGLEPALADKAPGAHDVGDDIDGKRHDGIPWGANGRNVMIPQP